jgi:heterotetrameric sarcosine oxidase delta subunit
MSLLVPCPNCGERDVAEFTCSGEVTERPRGAATHRELTSYLYFRKNVAGVQREWWYHRDGCALWFLVERDTRSNEVVSSELPPEPERPGAPGPEQPAVAEPPAV